MKKLFKITDADEKYPCRINKEVLFQHFGDRKFAVDVYEDLRGRLFYLNDMNWGTLRNVYIRLAPYDNKLGKLYFEPVELYHKAGNDLDFVNSATHSYEVWKDIIAENMPFDRQAFRVFADGEWGFFNVLTPNQNGVWCNAKLFEAMRFKESESIPVTFPIIGNKLAKGKLRRNVKLGKLYISVGSVYI